MEERLCVRCHQRPIQKFGTSANSYCKECRSELMKGYKKNFFERQRLAKEKAINELALSQEKVMKLASEIDNQEFLVALASYIETVEELIFQGK